MTSKALFKKKEAASRSHRCPQKHEAVSSCFIYYVQCCQESMQSQLVNNSPGQEADCSTTSKAYLVRAWNWIFGIGREEPTRVSAIHAKSMRFPAVSETSLRVTGLIVHLSLAIAGFQLSISAHHALLHEASKITSLSPAAIRSEKGTKARFDYSPWDGIIMNTLD